MTSWPKCCDLRLCGLRFCERRIGSALDPLRRSLRLASCEVHAAIGGTDCLRHCLRAASGALRAAIVPQHMPGLDAASCNLRAAACDWPTARGLRLADCGSRIAARGFAARPSSSVDTMRTCLASILRAAICDVHLAGRPTTRGLRLAERRLATRKRVERRHSTADCKLHVAARRMRPSGTKVNGLLRTFSDS